MENSHHTICYYQKLRHNKRDFINTNLTNTIIIDASESIYTIALIGITGRFLSVFNFQDKEVIFSADN